MQIHCLDKVLDISKPAVMGILNVTPDSFSDGGSFDSVQSAVQHALDMRAAGAAIIDIGGESTRPGADSVSTKDEIDRVVPVIEALKSHHLFDLPISIDTYKPDVMFAAVQAGAGFINDVNALQSPGALAAAVQLKVPVCIMHKQGVSATMQANPEYNDVVAEVFNFLRERADACLQAGVEQVFIDPGFGFGKTFQHNVDLFKCLSRFTKDKNLPCLVGVSRKRMIGEALDRSVDERLLGSVVLAALAAHSGAALLRVHDVAETVDALKLVKVFAPEN